MLKKFKSYGKELVKVLENKDALNEIISDEIDYSGINVPLVAVCNVPPVAQRNVPPQKWLQ